MALALHINSRTNLLRESAGKIRFIGSINQDHLKRRNILDLYGAHSRRKSCTHPCWQQNYARITLHQVEGFMGDVTSAMVFNGNLFAAHPFPVGGIMPDVCGQHHSK